MIPPINFKSSSTIPQEAATSSRSETQPHVPKQEHYVENTLEKTNTCKTQLEEHVDEVLPKKKKRKQNHPESKNTSHLTEEEILILKSLQEKKLNIEKRESLLKIANKIELHELIIAWKDHLLKQSLSDSLSITFQIQELLEKINFMKKHNLSILEINIVNLYFDLKNKTLATSKLFESKEILLQVLSYDEYISLAKSFLKNKTNYILTENETTDLKKFISVNSLQDSFQDLFSNPPEETMPILESNITTNLELPLGIPERMFDIPSFDFEFLLEPKNQIIPTIENKDDKETCSSKDSLESRSTLLPNTTRPFYEFHEKPLHPTHSGLQTPLKSKKTKNTTPEDFIRKYSSEIAKEIVALKKDQDEFLQKEQQLHSEMKSIEVSSSFSYLYFEKEMQALDKEDLKKLNRLKTEVLTFEQCLDIIESLEDVFENNKNIKLLFLPSAKVLKNKPLHMMLASPYMQLYTKKYTLYNVFKYKLNKKLDDQSTQT